MARIVDVLASRDVPDVTAGAARHHEIEFGRQDEETQSTAGERATRGLEQLGLAFGGVACVHWKPATEMNEVTNVAQAANEWKPWVRMKFASTGSP
jgi:hypothetical protein